MLLVLQIKTQDHLTWSVESLKPTHYAVCLMFSLIYLKELYVTDTPCIQFSLLGSDMEVLVLRVRYISWKNLHAIIHFV